MARLRMPAAALLVGVLAQVVIYLVAAGWMVALMVMIASSSSGSPGSNPVPGLVLLGVGAAFNIVSLAALGFVALGAVRMVRAHGYGWALGGAITQVAWGIIHGMLQLYAALGLGCVLAPIEVTIALVTGSIALITLADPRVHLTFQAVERYPELLSESAGEG